MWAKRNFRLIVMIATDNKVFWIELNWNNIVDEDEVFGAVAETMQTITLGGEAIN